MRQPTWCPELAFGELAKPRRYAAGGDHGPASRTVFPVGGLPRCPRCGALAALCSRARGESRRCDDTGLLARRATGGRA